MYQRGECGGCHTHVDLCGHAADRRHDFALKNAQYLGLHRGRHVADLVENRVPRCASRNPPDRSPEAPVKAPLIWPNSSDSSRSAGIAARIDRSERPPLSLAMLVKSARHQFLAGARFSED